MKRTNSILLTLFSLLLCSCVHEFAVIDNSFEFAAEITYDSQADERRLTLTRKSGAEGNHYKVAFTLDGERTMTLTDADGMTIEGFFNESFDDVSSRTYTMSRISPGEHTLNIEITTEEFSQSLAVTFVVEDFSFEFDTKVIFDHKSKTHSLEVTLKEGVPTDTYTIAFTVDNKEPRKTYQETFTDAIVKTFDLPLQEPGEHTVNLQITTSKHSQKADLPYKVNDYSFKMQADIEYDAENLSHILFLTLLQGSRDETYTVSYTVDGGHGVKLISEEGKELGASFTESFKDATVRSYDLSRAEKGKHTMKMIISTSDFSQVLEIPYAVDALPFSIHAEMDTSGSSSVMMLTLKEGDTTTEYNTSIILDGKTIASPKVNFSRSPIYRYTLPTTRPGKHDISVQLTDGYTVEKTSVSFSEPIRHPYIDITLKYNENSGKHIAEIGSNPYDISLNLATALTIKGNARVCTSTYEYYESDITYVTKSKTMSDSNTASGIYGGDAVTLIDRDALAAKMTSSYEMSNVMEYCCNPGDGENSDQIWWQSFKKERAYYYIVEESLKIDISGEKVPGVTLRIKNNIGAMTLNGKSNSSGTTNINL
ncbi:MAG: hypothetical protein IKY66_02675 [Bacteroidales bacterium]|nr:hypothetical protein [Bacteroidales bacterium]